MSEQMERHDMPKSAESLEEIVLPPLVPAASVQAPAAGEPPVEEPAAGEPPVEEPAAEAPAVEEPAAEEPAVEEPAAEAPAVEEPAAEEPPAQAVAEEQVFERPRTLKDLQPGMVLEGKITSVAIYGAFVDIGVGREGLVPISQLSDQPVASPTDVVQLGDMVSVRVVKVDPRSKRISLSMRERAERRVDTARLDQLVPGTVVDGTVTSIARFGAFVDIGVGRDGLIPLAQMDREAKDDPPQVGEQVQVRVMDVDKKTNRIRLSMRNIHESGQMAALRPGSIVSGKVTSLAPFGAFVDLGVGKDGLIHVSTMGEGGVRHPREVLQAGQEVEVRIVEVDPRTQRISLSMQLDEEPGDAEWSAAEEEEEEEPLGEVTLEDLAARFNKLRAGTRGEPQGRTRRSEQEQRAVRDALRRTLEGSKDR